jgi:glucose/arabinose dehydrogenase
MSQGAHSLQLATVTILTGVQVESARSNALQLFVTSQSTSISASSASGSPPASTGTPPQPGSPGTPPQSGNTTNDGTQYIVETLASGLELPSAVTVFPDGRLLAAEGSGVVRVWSDGVLLDQPAVKLADVANAGDVGLVGMTLHPQFASNHQVFVAYTSNGAGGGFVNRVVRLSELDSVLGEPVVLLEDRVDEMPQRTPRVRFGPDGKLYVAFPAGRNRSEADDPAVYAGKILRINEDGTTPADNASHSPIVSSGHRTPAAFAWDHTRQLWLAERDWGDHDALYAGASSSAAVYQFDSVVDPSAAITYTSTRIAGFTGNLFIAALDGQHIRRVQLDSSGAGVSTTERLVDGQFGRIGDVVMGPDGALYFCTSNFRRGSPGTPDRLLRLRAPSGTVIKPARPGMD